MRGTTTLIYRCFAMLVVGAILAGCTLPGMEPTATATPEPPTATPTATPIPATYWVAPGVPSDLAAAARPVIEGAGFVEAQAPEGARIQIVFNPPADVRLAAQRVYALVGPFPTIPDDIGLESLRALWQGGGAAPPGFDPATRFFVTPEIIAAMEPLLGKAGATVVQADGAGLVDAAWNARPSLAIVPFDQLEPRWKVISIDGRSPLDRTIDIATTYPLVVNVGVIAADAEALQVVDQLATGGAWLPTNRDTAKMSTLVMTGTTAMTRATGWFMDHQGVNYPSEKIMPFLADADLLHVSNEVSFTPKCPPAELNGGETFCSNPAYLELLKTIGVDVVELTGNHNLDYGFPPADYSLDLYNAAKITYFGGGRNTEDAQTPRILAMPDGTRVAFIGCNAIGPFTALASLDTPGAANCDDWEWVKTTIATLKLSQQAEIVVVALQYREIPQYDPTAQERADFEALAAAGADIVSGSQAHQPQGFSFASNKVIHFGVGNLFFDQMDHVENRQMFADKYVLYNGKIISLVLFTGMNENWSQPRPMTPEERVDFLGTIFSASGW